MIGQLVNALTKTALGGSLFCLTVAGVSPATGLVYNFTASSPRGIYKTADAKVLETTYRDSALERDPRRRAYVLVCPDQRWPTLRRNPNYRYPGTCDDGLAALIKPVAAWPGDTVNTSPSGVSVNGTLIPHSAPLSADSHGKELHHYDFGTYKVQPGQLWLISSYSVRSYDSRYYGPIPFSAVRAWLTPLAVERHAKETD